MNAKTEQYLAEIDKRCIREKDGVRVVLMRKISQDLTSRYYAWGRVSGDDFIRVSPLFTTVAQSIFYADVVPLLTEEEWKKMTIKDELVDIADGDKLAVLSDAKD